METITGTETFAILHCGAAECGVPFALADSFIKARKTDHQTFYCPNGHPRWWPGETPEQKIRRLEAEATHLRDQRDAAHNSATAHKGHATRARRQLERVENGVCPHCNRSFQNLRRHLDTQHAET